MHGIFIIFKITHPGYVSPVLPVLADRVIDEKGMVLMKVLKGLAFH
jgi:hypothetical protein